MTTQEMYTTILTLTNEGQGGYHSPAEIVNALNMGSTDKFNEEKRMFEDTGFISDNLRNFKVSADVTLTTGIGTLPTDYSYRTNASNNDNGRSVDIVNESEWINRINDPINPPSAKYGICAIRSNVQVLPTSIASIKLYYLKKPTAMALSYTVNGNGDVSISGSTNTNWPDDCHDDLILRALPYLGVPLSNEILIKFKSIKKSTEGV